MKYESSFQCLCWRACMVLCLAIALALPAVAQNPYGDPSTRVARLNYIQGSVSLQPAGEDEWVWASTNIPLTTSDSVWTGRGSRAELHVGSTAIRIAPRTAFSFLNLDDNSMQIELNAGTLNVRVRNLYRGDSIEVDTPNIAFTLLRRGDYRVTVDPDGEFTTVTVRSGQGQVDGGGQAFLVDSGSQVQVTGTEYISYDVYDLPSRDAFDRWTNARDLQESRYLSARYVSPEMTGYEDLDRYGTWRTDSNYGSVWIPTRVSNDWAPYRNGHWAWVEPWGWTWVDDAPFGFVTSHYGRWTRIDSNYGSNWAWVPPRRDQTTYQRPVYSPAQVTFVSVSSRDSRYANNVVWVPLAPGEVYVPSFRASSNYVQQVNQSNTAVQQQVITTAVNNPQQAAPSVNQRVAGAVTAMPKTAFASAQSVATSAVKVDQQAVATAPAAPAAPVAPVKASVVAGSAPPAKAAAPAPAPPAALVSRPVVAKEAPPPPPVKFENKQRALEATPGKPLDPKVEQNLRTAAPAPAETKAVITAPPAPVKPAPEMPKKPQPATSPNLARQEHPATPATGALPPGQQRAELARQQAAQQQAAQQQADKERAQQLAMQERAEKEKAQQEAALAKQQAAQQQVEKEKAQQLAAQQQAEKEKAQQLAAQQQADKQKAEQLAAQQQAEKQKAQQQAAQAQQQAAQQQAEKEKAQQLAAQRQAEKQKAEQLAAQQIAEKQRAQQQAAQAQHQAELAQQQAAKQQAEKEKAQQQIAQQQQAERDRAREQQQIAQARPPSAPPEKQPGAPSKAPEAQAATEPLRVPEEVQAAKLISGPQLGAPGKAHGNVRVRVLIGVDGAVKNATVLSGPPAMRSTVLENVRQRRYQPTLVNGKPVEVETEITIRF